MDYFSRLVSEEVVCRAGFNYHQPSIGLQNHNGQNYIVYLSQFGSDQLNIVVIEGTRPHKDGYKRKEWFFGTFGGNSPGQCANSEEYEAVIKEIKKIITRRNRVAGYKLEDLIYNANEKYFKELVSKTDK